MLDKLEIHHLRTLGALFTSGKISSAVEQWKHADMAGLLPARLLFCHGLRGDFLATSRLLMAVHRQPLIPAPGWCLYPGKWFPDKWAGTVMIRLAAMMWVLRLRANLNPERAQAMAWKVGTVLKCGTAVPFFSR